MLEFITQIILYSVISKIENRTIYINNHFFIDGLFNIIYFIKYYTLK